jgi:hypothetical protein
VVGPRGDGLHLGLVHHGDEDELVVGVLARVSLGEHRQPPRLDEDWG